MRGVIYSLLLVSFLYADTSVINKDNFSLPSKNSKEEFKVTLDWLKDKPKSITKDFYILQYLKEDISSKEALAALSMVKYVNNKIFFEFAKKFKNDETLAVIQCMNASAKELISTYDDCIKVGLSLYKATSLSQTQLNQAIQLVQYKYPNFAKQLKIISSSIPFTKVISTSVDNFYEIYLSVGGKFRVDYLNYKLPKSTILKVKKDKRFERLIKYSITNPKLDLLSKSFLNIDDKNFSSDTSFYLALNELNNSNFDKALKYLDNSYKKAYSQEIKNKVLFWKYQITFDNSFLKQLSNSQHIDLYSLYAKELLNKKLPKIKYDIALQHNETSKFDTTNPFLWVDVLKNTKDLDKQKVDYYQSIFTDEKTKPYLAYILNKYNNYKDNFYLLPYKEYLSNYPIKRQALVYSLARQESRFIPSSISTSYAQGVMQIMPFLSKVIAKRLNEKYNIFNQFDVKTNLRYANYHLNNLEKNVSNPLFIAYSYNGGYGYFKSLLNQGLFTKKGFFEPFMSMELISYDETREYGKKVLANYYIYLNYLDKKNSFKLSSIFENLIE
ncbi:lytic murein transglycosylase [Malaciobacter molluscorum LMG 25693]|uniref:Lytic murein transglycosylase n=1 Tax=Malaciobacter molluscorum LMG 25693 TaxID=870501 RepID=A0A2G1DI13_9BACT|nr:lytic transglycosylase domain-containing protein [Malaciobacter molluscorum]AXX92412.1 soluble lytic murein transglycosylase [Malaciobacter molluscorum LMG 25693]PHO18142.1 lytic murein transglycosylase [Malaciobacter molluscorum LMG 25693]